MELKYSHFFGDKKLILVQVNKCSVDEMTIPCALDIVEAIKS